MARYVRKRKKMLVIRGLHKDNIFGNWFRNGGLGWLRICDDARKCLMPEVDPKKTYDLKIYLQRPRGNVVSFLVKRDRWRAKPSSKWKPLGSIYFALIDHFRYSTFQEDISGEYDTHKFYAKAVESKAKRV
jgi:hypothetical protein